MRLKQTSKKVNIKDVCTLPRRVLGPHTAARPGKGVCRKLTGARARVLSSSARKGDICPYLCGPTTYLSSHRGPVLRGSDGSQRQGP